VRGVPAPAIRRLLGNGRARAPLRRAPEVIHILPDGDANLDVIAARVARLEEGIRLIAEALKRVHADLAAQLDALRDEVRRDVAEADARAGRAAERAVHPLAQAVARLAEAVEGFPHVLSAALEDVLRRIDHALAGPPAAPKVQGPALGPPVDPAPLQARPFDLEPVERQFGAPSQVIRVPDDPAGTSDAPAGPWEDGEA
jgi:hypothetical protein